MMGIYLNGSLRVVRGCTCRADSRGQVAGSLRHSLRHSLRLSLRSSHLPQRGRHGSVPWFAAHLLPQSASLTAPSEREPCSRCDLLPVCFLREGAMFCAVVCQKRTINGSGSRNGALSAFRTARKYPAVDQLSRSCSRASSERSKLTAGASSSSPAFSSISTSTLPEPSRSAKKSSSKRKSSSSSR